MSFALLICRGGKVGAVDPRVGQFQDGRIGSDAL